MAKTIRMNFDHAVQYVYNYAGSLISRTDINRGNAIVGCDRYTGSNFYEADRGNRYYLEVFYNIPSKSYEYKWDSAKLMNFSWSGTTTTYSLMDSREYDTWTDNALKFYPARSTIMFPNGPLAIGQGSSLAFDENAVEFLQANGYTQIRVRYTYSPRTGSSEYAQYKFEYKYTDYYVIPNIENTYIDYEVSEITCNTIATYPVDVYVRNDNDCVFTWDWNNSINRPLNYLYPTQYVLRVYKPDGTLLTQETVNGDTRYVTVSRSLLSGIAGQATYNISVKTNYSYVEALSATYKFMITGQTSAPNITSVSQDSFPTISWSCPNQSSWQMIIKQSNEVIYNSEMVSGSVQSYKVPVMLEDGSYSVEMRAMNIYGIYTGWSSKAFILNPTKPSAPTNVIVSANNDFGISVDCNIPEDLGKLFVVRRESGTTNTEMVGDYKTGFVDYTVPLNKHYEYAVRHYRTGYADSIWIDGTVIAQGVIIRNVEDLKEFVNVWMDEKEFDVITDIVRSDTLVQCVGRKYPVAEIGEWITSTRTFRGFVSLSDFDVLRKFKDNIKNVVLQNTEECIPCYMEIRDIGQHISGGRLVEFVLTRIHGE